jgi:hypothetical protein
VKVCAINEADGTILLEYTDWKGLKSDLVTTMLDASATRADPCLQELQPILAKQLYRCIYEA